jgi:hypothetical protein
MQVKLKSLECRLYALGFLFCLLGCNSNTGEEGNLVKDDYYEKCKKLVLQENNIGQEYVFKIKRKEIDELSVLYLGDIDTKQKRTLKFLCEINFSGQYEDSKRASSAVSIYDQQNKKIGTYYLSGESDVPTKIENTNLIFDYHNASCDQRTAIDFKDSIPDHIFIGCTGMGGDIYTFLPAELQSGQ